MDVSSLIKMVREREPLWNRQHPQYKDRELAAKLWGQVATYLNVDVESARYKWRGLRDTYRVQLRKLKRPGMRGMRNSIASRWEYFNDMTFVKDHIYLDVNSKPYRNLRKIEENSLDMDGYDEDNYLEGEGDDRSVEEEYQNLGELCETEMTEGDQELTEDFHKNTNGKIEENGHSVEEDIPSPISSNDKNTGIHFKNALFEALLANGISSLEDDNFCFLLSILPQLKSLPYKRNLYVRIKMQELLLEELRNKQNES